MTGNGFPSEAPCKTSFIRRAANDKRLTCKGKLHSLSWSALTGNSLPGVGYLSERSPNLNLSRGRLGSTQQLESLSSTRRKQREHWDRLAGVIPDFFSACSTQYYRRREVALIHSFLSPLRGKRILKLDLWNEAINTRILEWMSSQAAETYGLDLSFKTVARARRNLKQTGAHLRLLQADIREIPFKAETFDLMYTMGTIEHINEYRCALQEIQRVLKSEGRAIIGVPHRWNVFLRPLFVRALRCVGRYPYCPEKSFGAEELRRVVEQSGLRVIRRTGILAFPGVVRMMDLFFYTRNIPLHRATPFLLLPFSWLENRWEWPRILGYLVVVVAEKGNAKQR